MQVESYESARQRQDLREIAAAVMDVQQVQHMPPEERGIIKLTGELREEPQAAYDYLSPRLRQHGYTPLLQDDPAGAALLAVPGLVINRESRLWLSLLLFALTIASTIFVGGQELTGYSLGHGLAFSASLLSILLAHELGHFLAARRLGVAVSYPFFIPLPVSIIGTLGAFISMKEPPPDRRALLSIAIAGPLAGLVVAIPVLLLGLSLSEIKTFDQMEQEARAAIERRDDVEQVAYFTEGNSLLYAGAKVLVFGRFVPTEDADVDLHPVALAGWVGLLVTALNLTPAGQLDGGHIFYALAGPRAARTLTWFIVAVAVVLGFFWQGWLIWAALIALLGRFRAPLLNELTPLDEQHRRLAVIAIIVFILVFTPVPFTTMEPIQ
jgi:membrane-associated protease RseP (regulator of RpoE activity)